MNYFCEVTILCIDYKEYLNQIIRFNEDKDLLAMREKYNEPSFFEIISKERSETTFSSFLKWLFSCNTSLDSASPVMMLLDILVRRSNEQQKNLVLIPENLKTWIVSRKVKIQTLHVETEQPVSTLARDVFDALCKNNKDEYTKGYNSGWIDYPDFVNALQIASNSQDRIDLFIDCDIIDISGDNKKLQIIIENKIDSKEGGAKKYKDNTRLPKEYLDASQTGRYYLGTHRTDKKAEDVYQLYVYLTPLPSVQLDNLNHLKEELSAEFRDNEHFIQINYQDILDGIIVPLTHSTALSSRSRFFLEEFKNELTFPNVEATGGTSFIAVSEDLSEHISNKWEEYKTLITDSAISAVQEPIWYLAGTYYNYQPKSELLAQMIAANMYSQLQQKGWVSDKQDKKFNKTIEGSAVYYSSRIWFSSIEQFAQQEGIDIYQTNNSDANTKELLISFWEENKLFLSALMHSLKPEEKKHIQYILDSMAKRDTSKYMVYYDDRPICNQPLNNAQTVWRIVKLWVNLQQRTVSLEELNKIFPRRISHYYESGKWYQHLFVEKDNCTFDGENGNKQKVPDDCWDIDWGGKYDILLTYPAMSIPPKYATLLKMWRRDDTEEFIKYSMSKPEFKDKLSVVKER